MQVRRQRGERLRRRPERQPEHAAGRGTRRGGSASFPPCRRTPPAGTGASARRRRRFIREFELGPSAKPPSAAVRASRHAIELRQPAVQVHVVGQQQLAEVGRLAPDHVVEEQFQRRPQVGGQSWRRSRGTAWRPWPSPGPDRPSARSAGTREPWPSPAGRPASARPASRHPHGAELARRPRR